VSLDPRAEESYSEWDRVATEAVAILRSAADRDPRNRDLSELVGELATQSETFRTLSSTHSPLPQHRTKRFNHPTVGELSLSFNRLDLAADPGLTLFAYTAEPGSRSENALNSSTAGHTPSTASNPHARLTKAEAKRDRQD
jgi:hypothetical protein